MEKEKLSGELKKLVGENNLSERTWNDYIDNSVIPFLPSEEEKTKEFLTKHAASLKSLNGQLNYEVACKVNEYKKTYKPKTSANPQPAESEAEYPKDEILKKLRELKKIKKDFETRYTFEEKAAKRKTLIKNARKKTSRLGAKEETVLSFILPLNSLYDSDAVDTLSASIKTKNDEAYAKLKRVGYNPSSGTGTYNLNSLNQLITSNHNTVSYQPHQAISSILFSIFDATKPEGIKNIPFESKVPDRNKKALKGQKRWWTDDKMTEEGTTSDPIKDLIERVRFAKKNLITAAHFEVDKKLWNAFCRHSKVLTSVGYSYSPLIKTDAAALRVGSDLTEEELKTRVEKKIQKPIVVIDPISTAERYSKTIRKVDKEQIISFIGSNIVLVPDVEIGTIKTVRPIVLYNPLSGITIYDKGRTMRMRTIDTKPKIQYIESEQTVLTAPNKAKNMIYLTVK